MEVKHGLACSVLGWVTTWECWCVFFLPVNLNKFQESKCYFLGNLVLVAVLVMKLPLTTSADDPSSTPGHG